MENYKAGQGRKKERVFVKKEWSMMKPVSQADQKGYEFLNKKFLFYLGKYDCFVYSF